MTDERSGEGGAANTPPFPRLPLKDSTPRPSMARPGQELSAPAHPRAGDDPPLRVPPPRPAPVAENLDDTPLEPRRRSTTTGSQSRPKHRPLEDADPASSARPSPRQRTAYRRASSKIRQTFEEIADRLDDTAENIERIAGHQLLGTGARGRAGEAAQSAAGRMEELADYLRSNDLDVMRADFEAQIRRKPLQSLLVAAGAGWVLGKILR